MSFGFGISDFEYIAKLGLRLRNFVRSIKDAPRDFDALRAEADCLAICFHVIEYRECANVLRHVTYEQAEDLRTIMRGCKTNMQELVKFVAQCQRIAVDSTGVRPANKSLWQCFKEWGKQYWAKMEFVWADKQPMRDKLAIPSQSLNIYLVSLTFVSLSFNTRLSGGPHGPLPVPPKGFANWNLVAQKVAFKRANFSSSDLMRPGIEDAIVECASRIVNGGSCCEKCRHDEDKGKEKKPGAVVQIRVPRRPRRRSSFVRGISNNPSGMYLVRSKTLARSKSRTRSSVELVKTTRGYGNDSGSGSEDFDVSYISPNGTRSPTRRFPQESDYDDEAQSPYHDFSPRHEPSEYRGRDRAFEIADDEDDIDEAEMRDARHRGYAAARAEIQQERKEAIDEMTEGFIEARRAAQDPRRARSSSQSTQPDIRAYMEVMYGVIINVAPPEVERVNASRTRRPRAHDEPQYLRAAGTRLDAGESDIDSAPDSEPAINLYAGEEPRSRLRGESRKTSFAIPTHEYTPQTEAFEGLRTSMTDRDRDREHSLREREMSLLDREASLREREVALREREQRLRERRHSVTQQDMFSPPPDEYISRAPEPGRRERPERRRSTRFSEGDLQLNPEGHERRRMRRTNSQFEPDGMQLSPEDQRRHRMRRPGSFPGPDSQDFVRRDSFEEEEERDRVTHGRQQYRIDDFRPPRSRPRISNDPDNDDDGDEDDDDSFVMPSPGRY